MEQLALFYPDSSPKISLEEVFAAYYDCRKNKRRSRSALRFEINLEENLVQLWRELNDETYTIGQSVAFIVQEPVKREVFAANFRDRIVHHLVIRKIGYLLDQAISRHSYSCRKGMGTLYGIKKVYGYVKECSENYTKDCYVMRLDIRAFFMHIRHDKLCAMLTNLIRRNYKGRDKGLLMRLVRQIVMYRPQKNCVIRGSRENWAELPRSKSLFYAKPRRGLPIGNLTSQIFANFYLNLLDRFVSMQGGLFYGRYVDDMVLVHRNKGLLMRVLRQIHALLWQTYRLVLHPRKLSVQHYVKGFSFIGAFLLPWRMYAGCRLKRQFFRKIRYAKVGPLWHAVAVINSYFGFLRHYKTLHLRLKGWGILRQRGEVLCLDKRGMRCFSHTATV